MPVQPGTVRSSSSNWESYDPIALITIFHIFAIFVYAQLLNAFPARHDVPQQQQPVPADTAFITAGFVLMLISIFRLFTRSRSIGSSFLLPLGILSFTSLCLLFALRLAIALSVPIDPTSLTHALPFLISIVGFDKPLRLAHAVFYTPYAYTLHGYCPPLPPFTSPDPIPLILLDAFHVVFLPIIKNYFIEIKLLAIAAYLPFGAPALRPLCALAALALVIQYLLIWTYFVLILSVFLSNCAIKMLFSMANFITNIPTLQAPSSSSSSSKAESKLPQLPPPSLSFLLGEEGRSLYSPTYTIGPNSLQIATTVPDLAKDGKKHSAWRLQLVVFTSFLLFNFLTPLITGFSFSHQDHPTINQPSLISNISRAAIVVPTGSSTMIAMLKNAGTNHQSQFVKEVHTDTTHPSPHPPSTPPFPPNPSSNISLTLSRTRFTLTLTIPTPILPNHLVLSFSMLGMLALCVLLNVCLVFSKPAEGVVQGGLMMTRFSVDVGPRRGGGGGGGGGGGTGGVGGEQEGKQVVVVEEEEEE